MMPRQPSTPPAIEVRNLTKRFDDLTAVDNISFTIREGEIFAFLGPNGAGKTTTIKVLTTLLRPTSGSVHISGIDVVHDPEKARYTFGIVFQDPSLDDELTAWENMEYHAVLYHVPAADRARRIQELMRLVGLWDRRNDLVKTFSGGTRRRLEIARGFLHRPRVLFLDEPTLGLDPQTKNWIWTYLRELNRDEGTTIFFTTHDMDEAERMAQRVAIIDYGRIVSLGSPTELMERTHTKSLEDAYLALTGRSIREERVSGILEMRQRHRLWRRR